MSSGMSSGEFNFLLFPPTLHPQIKKLIELEIEDRKKNKLEKEKIIIAQKEVKLKKKFLLEI